MAKCLESTERGRVNRQRDAALRLHGSAIVSGLGDQFFFGGMGQKNPRDNGYQHDLKCCATYICWGPSLFISILQVVHTQRLLDINTVTGQFRKTDEDVDRAHGPALEDDGDGDTASRSSWS